MLYSWDDHDPYVVAILGPQMRAQGSPLAAFYALTDPQSLANNADTVLSGYTAQSDTLGAYSAANPTRLTAPTAGVYLVGLSVPFPIATYSQILAWLKFNGGFASGTNQAFSSGIAMPPTLNLARPFSLAAGDFFEIDVFQSSGGARATPTGPGPTFYMVRL